MKLESLEAALSPLGWRRTGDALESPSGDVWVTEAELDSRGPGALYASMARRAENALRHGAVAAADELRASMRALAGDPRVERMLALHDAARRVFEAWSVEHGLSLRFWDFSRASIRAEARHPAGGIACIEWLDEEPSAPRLFVHHWVDDRAAALRRSWRVAVDAAPAQSGALVRQLDDAVRLLLAERAPEDYAPTSLAPSQEEGDDADRERALEVLR